MHACVHPPPTPAEARALNQPPHGPVLAPVLEGHVSDLVGQLGSERGYAAEPAEPESPADVRFAHALFVGEGRIGRIVSGDPVDPEGNNLRQFARSLSKGWAA